MEEEKHTKQEEIGLKYLKFDKKKQKPEHSNSTEKTTFKSERKIKTFSDRNWGNPSSMYMICKHVNRNSSGRMKTM